MNKVNRIISFLAIFVIFVFSNLLVAQEYGTISYGDAINISGKQRMLSQKISKAFLIRNMGYDNFVTKKEMDSCIRLFNQQHQLLLANTDNPSILLRLEKVNKFWKNYQKHFTKIPNIITADKIVNENSTLLKLSNDVVKEIEYSYYENSVDKNPEKVALLEVINISGRQRMLSQRLCLYYAAGLTFNKQNNDYKLHLRMVYEEFDLAITQLIMSKINNDRVREEIAKLLFLWHNIKSVETKLCQLKLEISDVYEITNKLTEVFEGLTNAYKEVYNKLGY